MTGDEDPDNLRVAVHLLTTIEGDDVDVHVKEVETPKGERLELETGDGADRIRLDAVALESLTWQDFDSFARLVVGTDASAEAIVTAYDGEFTATPLTQITNEFGHVNVRELETPDGQLLELDAQNMAYSAQLNAAALAAIARLSIEAFGTLIREKIE